MVSEPLRADTLPVSVRVSEFDPGCALESGWPGEGDDVFLTRESPLSGGPLTIRFDTGLMGASGLPLRAPEGEESFVLDGAEGETTVPLPPFAP